MNKVVPVVVSIFLSTGAQAAEYMEKTPFQLSRAFSPGVITSGGTIVWVAGQDCNAGQSRNQYRK